jgi:Secretion system C-terminal sorting domain
MKKVKLLISGLILSAATAFAQLSPANTPDTYGYVWRDTTYGWVDITAPGMGVEVAGLSDDNVIGPINMGMTFKHYWNTYSNVYIGSNGYISFANVNIASAQTVGFPAMPPMMCDFGLGYAGGVGKVFTYHDVANNRFIITYDQVPFWVNTAANFDGSNTFQIILDGNTNNITFNYKSQIGSWNPDYDATTNPMVSGIENSTGQYGLFVANKIKPTDSTSIIFLPPAVAGVNVTDAAPINVQNPANGGFFIKPNGGFPLSTVVANTGNVDITGKITAVATVKTKNNVLMHVTSDTINGLLNGASMPITFDAQYITDSASSYKLEVKTTLTGDMNAGNNTKSVEMVAIGTNAQNEEVLSFVTYGSPNSGVSWQGGAGNSGGGVYFVPYTYPTIVKAIEIMILPTAAAGANYTPNPDSIAYYLQMYDDQGAGGTIGQPLVNDTILGAAVTMGPAPAGQPLNWSRHDLASPVIVANGGVYVGWLQKDDNLILAAEDTFNVSRRTYEILNNSWAVYRDVDNSDFFIRLITEKTDDPVLAIHTPSELKGMEVYPNPSHGIFTVNMKFDQSQNAMLKVMDMTGRKVFMELINNQSVINHNLNLSHLAKGMYMVQIATDKGVATQKIFIE